MLCRCGRFRSVAVSLALPYRRETLTTSVLHLGSAERRGRYTQTKPRSKPAGAFSYWPMGQTGFPGLDSWAATACPARAVLKWLQTWQPLPVHGPPAIGRSSAQSFQIARGKRFFTKKETVAFVV